MDTDKLSFQLACQSDSQIIRGLIYCALVDRPNAGNLTVIPIYPLNLIGPSKNLPL